MHNLTLGTFFALKHWMSQLSIALECAFRFTLLTPGPSLGVNEVAPSPPKLLPWIINL